MRTRRRRTGTRSGGAPDFPDWLAVEDEELEGVVTDARRRTLAARLGVLGFRDVSPVSPLSEVRTSPVELSPLTFLRLGCLSSPFTLRHALCLPTPGSSVIPYGATSGKFETISPSNRLLRMNSFSWRLERSYPPSEYPAFASGLLCNRGTFSELRKLFASYFNRFCECFKNGFYFVMFVGSFCFDV